MRAALTGVALCLAMGGAMGGAARAQPIDVVAQSQMAASLFIKGCVAFGGDAGAMRRWIAEQRLAALPPGGQDAFLNGLPGLAYDASDRAGKYVLVTEDGGGCSAVADHADPGALLPAVEQTLRAAGMTVERTSQKADPLEPTLLHTGYFATKGSTTLSVLVSTSGVGGEAMLSLLRPLVTR